MKKSLTLFLSFCLGVVFLLSAFSKLFPIEPFEYNLVTNTFMGWQSSPVFARIIIAIEFYLGVVFLFSYHLKRNIAFAAFLLLVFNTYIGYQLAFFGNKGNCGCFGNLINLTPLQSLIKNTLMLLCLFVLSRIKFNFKWQFKYSEPLLFLLCCITIFTINPIFFATLTAKGNNKITHKKLELNPLYEPSNHAPSIDIRRGKHVLALLSTSCVHCRIAAQKFKIIHQRNSAISIYFLINGDSTEISNFLKITETENIPHSQLNSRNFYILAGTEVPAIYYLNNAIVQRQVDYFSLDQNEIENWMKLNNQ